MEVVQPSNEEPPRGHGEKVKADMPDSQTQEVQHEIDEERDADAIGKRRAGIK